MAISDTIESMRTHLSNAYTKLTEKQASIPTNKNLENLESTIDSISVGVDTSDATATANDILLGKTAYANGAKITGTIETYAGDGSETVNKLVALVDGSPIEITAEDLTGATKFRDYAFFFSTLTSITIPNSVTSIGHFAFRGSSLLTSVIISNSVTKIGSNAFNSCSKLTSITIPNSVTKIDSYALQIGSKTNKATITMLPTTPPTIQSSTFDKSYLQKIIVPAGTGATYKAATNWSNFADYIEEASSGATLISFTIAGTSYQAEEGMTWQQWVDSSYNTGGYSYITRDTVSFIYKISGSTQYTLANANNSIANLTDEINANNAYIHMAYPNVTIINSGSVTLRPSKSATENSTLFSLGDINSSSQSNVSAEPIEIPGAPLQYITIQAIGGIIPTLLEKDITVTGSIQFISADNSTKAVFYATGDGTITARPYDSD